jgi:penicillin-binding protein 2
MNTHSLLYLATIIALSFLGIRLAQLQIFEHDKYKVLAKNDTSRATITRAPRGSIYDRNGQIIASSKQSLSVVVYPNVLRKKRDKRRVAKTLSNFINISYEELCSIFDKMDPRTPLSVTLANEITVEDAIKIYDNSQNLPGIVVEKQATRYYPHHEIIAHAIGYVGEISNHELKEGRSRGLVLGDIVGKTGLEKAFDSTLQGIKGEERVTVDRFGKSVKFGDKEKKIIQEAQKGDDLHTTIDIELQKIAYEALKDINGAAVVIDVQNGSILTLLSTPSYDPNIFTKPIPYAIYSDLASKKAFVDRSLSSFTPGSVWKIFTSLTGLEHNVIKPEEKLYVSGRLNYGGFVFGDWTNKEAIMGFYEAFAWSRNTYFYQIAKRMKPEWIANIARKFGAEQQSGIEIEGESLGLVPDPEWKLRKIREPWFPGNTLHLAIGQSFLLLSPLQVVRMISGVATEGKVPRLHLIQNHLKEDFEMVTGINPLNYKIVKTAMEQCVDSGTGGATKMIEVKIAGKTGSAEVRGFRRSTHSWFASYAPADNPRIAMVVFGEGEGHGGSISAPRARKIYQKLYELGYFN